MSIRFPVIVMIVGACLLLSGCVPNNGSSRAEHFLVRLANVTDTDSESEANARYDFLLKEMRENEEYYKAEFESLYRKTPFKSMLVILYDEVFPEYLVRKRDFFEHMTRRYYNDATYSEQAWMRTFKNSASYDESLIEDDEFPTGQVRSIDTLEEYVKNVSPKAKAELALRMAMSKLSSSTYTSFINNSASSMLEVDPYWTEYMEFIKKNDPELLAQFEEKFHQYCVKIEAVSQ